MNKNKPSLWQKLRRDERGVSVVEFAFAGPIFLSLLMGVLDFGYALYVKAVLQGAVEEAGRGASLENTTAAAIDAKVADLTRDINNSGTRATSRLYYEDYVDVEKPEEFTDTNSNGIRNAGECFVDRNGNAVWDSNVGLSGRGGAQDVVVYSVTFQYQRIFPLWSMLGQSQTQTLTARTHLRNQPFSAQAARTGVQICT
jgi:Flp pilus assembly protein TadG